MLEINNQKEWFQNAQLTDEGYLIVSGLTSGAGSGTTYTFEQGITEASDVVKLGSDLTTLGTPSITEGRLLENDENGYTYMLSPNSGVSPLNYKANIFGGNTALGTSFWGLAMSDTLPAATNHQVLFGINDESTGGRYIDIANNKSYEYGNTDNDVFLKIDRASSGTGTFKGIEVNDSELDIQWHNGTDAGVAGSSFFNLRSNTSSSIFKAEYGTMSQQISLNDTTNKGLELTSFFPTPNNLLSYLRLNNTGYNLDITSDSNTDGIKESIVRNTNSDTYTRDTRPYQDFVTFTNTSNTQGEYIRGRNSNVVLLTPDVTNPSIYSQVEHTQSKYQVDVINSIYDMDFIMLNNMIELKTTFSGDNSTQISQSSSSAIGDRINTITNKVQRTEGFISLEVEQDERVGSANFGITIDSDDASFEGLKMTSQAVTNAGLDLSSNVSTANNNIITLGEIRNGSVMSSDTTANRPSTPVKGQLFFDDTLGYPIVYNGTNWVNFNGAVLI